MIKPVGVEQAPRKVATKSLAVRSSEIIEGNSQIAYVLRQCAELGFLRDAGSEYPELLKRKRFQFSAGHRENEAEGYRSPKEGSASAPISALTSQIVPSHLNARCR